MLFAVFCNTGSGDCMVVVEAEDKKKAEEEATLYLRGGDEDGIDDVRVIKSETIDPHRGPCVFWDNELEQGEEGPA
jgi:hypothetical protein